MTSIQLHQATVTRGPRLVLDRVDFRLGPGRRVGVTGPNGVGKSTLLAACGGAVRLASGELRIDPPDATVGYLVQEPSRSEEHGRALLRRRTGVADAETALQDAAHGLADDVPGAADAYDRAWSRWERLGAADFDARVGTVADQHGLDERLLDRPTTTLSGGEAARVQLAALLCSRFDLYLLDEPTNDLDADGLDALESWVVGLDHPVALVSHDRRFLSRVVTDVADIDPGGGMLRQYAGGWDAFEEERSRARRRAEEAYGRYRRTREELAARAQRQREWADQGRAAVRRGRSGEPDKFIRHRRIDQTEQLAARAAQTGRAIDRLEVVEKPWEPWQLRLDLPDAGRSADIAVRMSGVAVTRGETTIGPVDLLLTYGDRVALVGPNGAGKSTLIEVIAGRLAPDDGTVSPGPRVIVGEIEQVRRHVPGPREAVARVEERLEGTTEEARRLLAKFGIGAEHLDRSTASWSPGERTRAALAVLMAAGTNLLILDEPTNHLDLPAIEQLETALDSFDGTLIVVSHDREFLDRIRFTRRWTMTAGRFGDGSLDIDPKDGDDGRRVRRR